MAELHTTQTDVEPNEHDGLLLYGALFNNTSDGGGLLPSKGPVQIQETVVVGPLDSGSVDRRTGTTATETASDSDDGAFGGNTAGELPCAWGPLRPNCCQKFRSPKVVLVFLCLVAVVQVCTMFVRSCGSVSIVLYVEIYPLS